MPLGILIDENLHPALEEPLRARGHRADHAQSIGMASRPDPELLDAARRYGCFMTADRLQDRDSKIAAYRFMRDGNRIIHFGHRRTSRSGLRSSTATSATKSPRSNSSPRTPMGR